MRVPSRFRRTGTEHAMAVSPGGSHRLTANRSYKQISDNEEDNED